ncbi:MAG: hypothetical protein KatS3mg077_2565 [Candidatus Binatia bacterium]|nr:MAG: hypothetical protein KatS3mg077_2565 [Candidatus Binatia bacterium]
MIWPVRSVFDVKISGMASPVSARQDTASAPGQTPVRAWDMIAIGIVRLYQLFLSPLLGPCCRFSPSCSEYACQAIAKYGTWRGGTLALKRIGRCHPWSPGGWDPVP